MLDAIREEIRFWRKVDGAIDFICAIAIMCGGAFIVASIL